MLKKKNGILLATLVFVSATSQCFGQTVDWTPAIDPVQTEAIGRLMHGARSRLPKLRTDLPLIDDVLDKTGGDNNSKTDESKVITCQLNAPISLQADSAGETNSNTGGENECQNLEEACGDLQERYCRQVAGLLAITLAGPDMDPATRMRTIETAMKFVSEKAAAAAEEKMKQLKSTHQQSLDRMQESVARKSTAPESRSIPNSQLEAVYATQYRNTKQLEALIAANRSLQRSIGLLELQFASFAMMQRAKFSQPEVRRMVDSVKEQEADALEVEMLQNELQALNQRLLQLQANPVRPAMHLEPVYVPERPLQPIVDPYQR